VALGATCFLSAGDHFYFRHWPLLVYLAPDDCLFFRRWPRPLFSVLAATCFFGACHQSRVATLAITIEGGF